MATATVNKQSLKECPYGTKCLRKNPIHFGEFSHIHLDRIYETGLDATSNEYTIPSDLSKELILTQLKLLEKLFPKPNANNLKKVEVSAGKEINNKNVNSSSTNINESCVLDGPSGSKIMANKQHNQFAATTSQYEANFAKKPKVERHIKVVDIRNMASKLESSAPYNMFLTTVNDSMPTHNEPLTVSLRELLDASLGEIESSVQINFVVDIGWLLNQYYFAGIAKAPLLVLYGDDTPQLQTISQYQPHVTTVKVNMTTAFSTSHTKMMLFAYKDGSMRVVISTANLYPDDWHNRTQGIWISPKLHALPDDADTTAGESPTNFKQDLMLYLAEYKISQLQPWIARMRKLDFSAINVFFIGSVPGTFQEGPGGYPWGHARIGSLLQKHSAPIESKIPVVCQSSTIGNLGANIHGWVQQDFLNSLRKSSKSNRLQQLPTFKLIYPSLNNVNNSHDGMYGGGCLLYGKAANDKQPWLQSHLYGWSSGARFRSRAMPHIKSYTRYNLAEQSIYWFVLTSANFSRAAWGSFNKNAKTIRVSNYEAGVLFLPKFVTGEETFPLGHCRGDVPPFPLPYDVPLTPYAPDDTPFLIDYIR